MYQILYLRQPTVIVSSAARTSNFTRQGSDEMHHLWEIMREPSLSVILNDSYIGTYNYLPRMGE